VEIDTRRYEGDKPRADRETPDMRETRPIAQEQTLDAAHEGPGPVLAPEIKSERDMEAQDQLIEQETLFMNDTAIGDVLPPGMGLTPKAIEAVRDMWQGREVIVDDLKHAMHGAVEQVASPAVEQVASPAPPDNGSA
jgi:hypothetical protein